VSKITFFFAHLALCLQLANCTTLTGTASFDDKSKRRYSDKELRRILKNEVMEKDKSFKPAEN